MKIFGVIMICNHFYFIRNSSNKRQVPLMSCHVLKCLDATNVVNLQFFIVKIILEVLKIDLFEG